METAIIIPARYGSTRFPGKPLAKIAGKTMLERVVNLARKAAQDDPSIHIIVATDDERIKTHAIELNATCVMTPVSCPTGTDRVSEAVKKLDFMPNFILNLQGDAPMTPPAHVRVLIDSFCAQPCDLITPVVRLSWDELDALREHKKTTPFSGTTAVFNEKTGNAYWFSKNVIPAIRGEEKLRSEGAFSPIWRHIGLYGYAHPMLKAFSTLPEGHFEALEGLEQLRLLENGFKIRCVPVEMNGTPSLSGIDSPEDIVRAEALITR
ncbi:MAG TPA: 3-deoxy-manno-octulosonate cytidylyltransferase [Rhodospirillaceae bacterium]|nr:3-deoxy-manno-octulosonate cytidylyltransferase [Rhodospirillaceae bacterium]